MARAVNSTPRTSSPARNTAAARATAAERWYGSEAEYVAMIATDGAAYHWKMDEASGNFLPTIGAITLSAANVSYRAPGRISHLAAQFNGSTSYAVTASALQLSAYSRVVVEAIVWHEHTLSNSEILWEYGSSFIGGAGRFICTLDGGNTGTNAKAYIGVRGNVGTNYTEVARPSAGVWYHIATVYDFGQTPANEMKLYVNGIEYASSGVSSTVNDNTDGFANEVLNVASRNASSIFAGVWMQHLAVYPGAAMTLAKIQEHAAYVARFRALP